MNPLLEAAHEVAGVCHERSLRYCFIGGLAVLRWEELGPLLELKEAAVDLERLHAILDHDPR